MLTAQVLYALTGCLIMALGLRTALLHASLLRRVVAINVMGTGVFMILLAIAYRGPGAGAGPRSACPGADRHRGRGERDRTGPGAGATPERGARR